jgi:hypothetical protein
MKKGLSILLLNMDKVKVFRNLADIDMKCESGKVEGMDKSNGFKQSLIRI